MFWQEIKTNMNRIFKDRLSSSIIMWHMMIGIETHNNIDMLLIFVYDQVFVTFSLILQT